MIVNRSAPPGPVVPWLIYEDVAKAIDWLCGAFGFTERLRTPPEPDGSIHHAQLAVGEGSVVLTAERPALPARSSLFVRVEAVDAHYDRAKRFGARIVKPPASHAFGERQYSAKDFAGHEWTFSQSVADVDPEEWGARVGVMQNALAVLARPRLCYLEVPAGDVHRSATFYEKVFGWNIRHRESDRPSFDDATGNVSGAFVTGRAASREPGLLAYIWVDGIDATLARAAAEGGKVVESPRPDHPGSTAWIATFFDPAGNMIGLYEEAPRIAVLNRDREGAP
jgi:predicted enzyme related to lactoylglutathione lyase